MAASSCPAIPTVRWPSILRSVTVFELFRSRLGRRSREQVRSCDWTGSDDDIDAVLDSWFIFGPSLLPIDE